MYKQIGKSKIDLLLALIILILILPLFIIITIILIINNKGNPFFIQSRPGKSEIIFKVIKFKTMFDLRDSNGNLLPDHKRLTRIGRFIRKTSLDELPQLINVIIGNMSLVGPRPLSVKYLNLYSSDQRKRHNVKPGITGWAQVNGRNAISWDEKFKLDSWYIDNISFSLDIKIILLTLKKVFFREGVLEEGSSQFESFNGNN